VSRVESGIAIALMAAGRSWLTDESPAVGDAARELSSERRRWAQEDASVSRSQYRLWSQFQRFASLWRNEVGFSSSTSEIVGNPWYLRIIGLGPGAIPLLLREMEQNPDHWSPALEALTQASPVRATSQGRLLSVAGDWVDWGKSKNLL